MSNFKGAPLVRFLFPFILGILGAIYFPFYSDYTVCGSVMSFSVLIFLFIVDYRIRSYRLKFGLGVFYNLSIAILGYGNTIRFVEPPQILSESEEVFASVVVSEIPVEKDKSYKIVADEIFVKSRLGWKNHEGKAILYLSKDSAESAAGYGDRLLIMARFSELSGPQNLGEFNYKQYLNFHQIYHQAFIKAGKWKIVSMNNGNILVSIANNFRNDLIKALVNCGLDSQELAVASALLLGEKSGLDDELIKAYSDTGAMHVLAVSGLHVGIIFMVFNSLFFFLDRVKNGNIYKAIILILVLWSYALITGLSPSVLRAATMFSLIVIGKSFKRYTNIYNTLAVSAILLLIINPMMIMEVGFQLSYLAVIGIVFLHPKIHNLWIPRNNLLDKIWGLTSVSIAAQLATFPLGLLYFHQFPNYFLFSNLIVIPVSTLVIYLGIFTLVCSGVEFISDWSGLVLKFIIKFLNDSVKWIESFPFSILDRIYIDAFQAWLLYLLIALTIFYFVRQKSGFLLAAISILGVLSVITGFNGYENLKQDKFVVYNINKATAITLKSGNKGLLIANENLINDENKLKFHTQAYRAIQGITKEELMVFEELGSTKPFSFDNKKILLKENFIQMGGKRILLLKDLKLNCANIRKVIKLDFLVISSNFKMNPNELVKCFEIETIIIDSSVSDKAAKWLKMEAGKLGVKCLFVKQTGTLEFLV